VLRRQPLRVVIQSQVESEAVGVGARAPSDADNPLADGDTAHSNQDHHHDEKKPIGGALGQSAAAFGEGGGMVTANWDLHTRHTSLPAWLLTS